MGQAISKTVAIAEIIKVRYSCYAPFFSFVEEFILTDILASKTEKNSPLASGSHYQLSQYNGCLGAQ